MPEEIEYYGVLASTEERCHQIARAADLKAYIPFWDIASCLKLTGKEVNLIDTSTISEIPISDRFLMNEYVKHVKANPYNGFGFRLMSPEKVDDFVKVLCFWVEKDEDRKRHDDTH